MNRKVIILADDLTGAQDTAISLLKRGFSTEVTVSIRHLVERWDTSEVWALTTETRFLEPQAASERLRDYLSALNGRSYTLYKKVDSTLRGNIGAEIEATLAATGKKVAILAPALPHGNRTVVDGVAYVDGHPLNETECGRDPFTPVAHARIADIIAAQSDLPIRHIPLAGMRAGADAVRQMVEAEKQKLDEDEASVVICDAETDADLAALRSLIHDPDILFVGSSGLLSALYPIQVKPLPIRPFVVVVGSLNSTSQIQADQFAQRLDPIVVLLDAEAASADPSGEAARARAFLAEQTDLDTRHVLVRCTTNPVTMPQSATADVAAGRAIADALSSVTLAALQLSPNRNVFASGGDLSASLLRLAGADGVRLAGEAGIGIPYGFVVGGIIDGTCFVSKAGGFGEPDALLHVINEENA